MTARVAAIVLAVAARTHPSMTEVARTVGLPVSTTDRLLSGLVAGRLVERTMQGRYLLDPSALPTWSGSAALRAHISAAVALQSMLRDMDIDDSNVNVSGGAISMGHPVGASGARVALHLALELGRRGGGLGAAGLCGGGGQGEALLLHVPA